MLKCCALTNAFYFKNHIHFPNLNVKTHIFTNPRSCLFILIFFKYLFSILSRDPNEQLQNISSIIFFFITKMDFLNIFWRSKNWPFENIVFKFFLYVLEPRWTIVPHLLYFLDNILKLKLKPPRWTPGHWFPTPPPL